MLQTKELRGKRLQLGEEGKSLDMQTNERRLSWKRVEDSNCPFWLSFGSGYSLLAPSSSSSSLYSLAALLRIMFSEWSGDQQHSVTHSGPALCSMVRLLSHHCRGETLRGHFWWTAVEIGTGNKWLKRTEANALTDGGSRPAMVREKVYSTRRWARPASKEEKTSLYTVTWPAVGTIQTAISGQHECRGLEASGQLSTTVIDRLSSPHGFYYLYRPCSSPRLITLYE